MQIYGLRITYMKVHATIGFIALPNVQVSRVFGAHLVVKCFPHQSQPAVIVCWSKLAAFHIAGLKESLLLWAWRQERQEAPAGRCCCKCSSAHYEILVMNTGIPGVFFSPPVPVPRAAHRSRTNTVIWLYGTVTLPYRQGFKTDLIQYSS